MLKVNETILESDSQAYRDQVLCDFTWAIRKIADAIVARDPDDLNHTEQRIANVLKQIRAIKEE